MEHSIKEIIQFSESHIRDISKIIPAKIIDTSNDKNKIPFKIKSLEYVLALRIVDLSKVVFLLFNRKKHLAVIILVRSIMETGSIMVWLSKQVENFTDRSSGAELNKFLMKYLFGSKTFAKENPINPYNILKAIDIVDKEVKGFRNVYDILSEYLHPNYSGTMNSYSKQDVESGILNLFPKRKISEEIYIGPFGSIIGLSLNAMQIIDEHYDRINIILTNNSSKK